MDVYQETFEKISAIVVKSEKKSAGCSSKTEGEELDMYSDDFDAKVKVKKEDDSEKKSIKFEEEEKEDEPEKKLMWEFKWSQGDDSQVHGPNTTRQMQQWVHEGFFKTGVWVRKCGQEGPFYTSNRIDFELYL